MSRPADFETLLAGWLADDGPSDVPPRVAEGAITRVRAMTSAPASPMATTRRATWWQSRAWLLAAALALVGVTVAIAFAVLRPSPEPPPPSIVLPANGLIVASEDGDLITVDPVSGTRRVLTEGIDDDILPTVAPDGSVVAWWRQDGIDQTWSLMIQGIGPDADGSMVGFPVEQPNEAIWAPGSDRLAVLHAVGDAGRLTIIDRQGSLVEDVPDIDANHATWRPDGRALAVQTRGDTAPELVLVPSTGGDPVSIVQGEPAAPDSAEMLQLWSASWSPDGRWIAYVSNVDAASGPDGSPASRVFVMDPDGGGRRLLEVPADATTQGLVRWSADSTALLVRVIGETTTSFVKLPLDGSAGVVLAELDGTGWHVAWSPDEQRLVAARRHEPAVIIDLATDTRTPQAWISAYDLAWQPLRAP